MRGLDTYYGRKITAINDDSEGNWFIELDGGVRIINMDLKLTKPKISDPQNLAFIAATFEPSATTMIFGAVKDGQIVQQYRAVFNPTNYAIYDASQQAVAWSPQMNQDRPDIVIPDFPVDREQTEPQPTQAVEEPSPQDKKSATEPLQPRKATERSGKKGKKTS